jgi:poly(A) polymerase-like protein
MNLEPVRSGIARETLKLPACALPRPGDLVLWHENSLPITGILIGHSSSFLPCIETPWNMTLYPPSFDAIRIYDRETAVGPNWLSLPNDALVVEPTPKEQAIFDDLLEQSIPKGSKHIDLLYEIWARGYEVFVIGGTVRDVVAGIQARDIDISTTMPLDKLACLVGGMYGATYEISDESCQQGELRLGGRPGSTDPFIDISVFKHLMPGTPNAIFGSSFLRDIAHRDFACNSVYYDPINRALIDPTGNGLVDAKSCQLRTVFDARLQNQYQVAQIAIRMIKFRVRGFGAARGHEAELQQLIKQLQAMGSIDLVAYVKSQVFGSLTSSSDRAATFDLMREVFMSLGEKETWEVRFNAFREEFLS